MAATRRRTPGKTGVFWTKDPEDSDIVKVHVPGVILEPAENIKAPMVKMPVRSRKPRIVTLSGRSRRSLGDMTVVDKEKASQMKGRTETSDKPTKDDSGKGQKSTKKLTLKDLGPEDKRRIANLVKELAKVGEEREVAFSQLTEERQAFEERLHILQEEYDKIIDEKLYIQNRFLELQGLLKKYNTGNVENVRLSPPRSLPKSASKSEITSPLTGKSPLSQIPGNSRQLQESHRASTKLHSPKSPMKKQQRTSRQSTPLPTTQGYHFHEEKSIRIDMDSERGSSPSVRNSQGGNVKNYPSESIALNTRQSPARRSLNGSSSILTGTSSIAVPEKLYPNAELPGFGPGTANQSGVGFPGNEQTHRSGATINSRNSSQTPARPVMTEQPTIPVSHPVPILVTGNIPVTTSAIHERLAMPNTMEGIRLPVYPGQVGALGQAYGVVGAMGQASGVVGAMGQASGVVGPVVNGLPSQLPLINMANTRAPSDTSQCFATELDTVYRLYYREYELQLQLQQQQLELQKQQLQLQQQLQQLELLQQQQKQTAGTINQAASSKTIIQETPTQAPKSAEQPKTSDKKLQQKTNALTKSKANHIKATPPREIEPRSMSSPANQERASTSRDFHVRDVVSPVDHIPSSHDENSELLTRSRSPVAGNHGNKGRVMRKIARRTVDEREYDSENVIPPTDQSEASYVTQRQREVEYYPHRPRETGYDADSSQVSGSVLQPPSYIGRQTDGEHHIYEPRGSWYEPQRRKEVAHEPRGKGYEVYGQKGIEYETVGPLSGYRPRERGYEVHRPTQGGYGEEYGNITRTEPYGRFGSRSMHGAHDDPSEIPPFQHFRGDVHSQRRGWHSNRGVTHTGGDVGNLHPGYPRSETGSSVRDYDMYPSDGDNVRASRQYTLHGRGGQQSMHAPGVGSLSAPGANHRSVGVPMANRPSVVVPGDDEEDAWISMNSSIRSSRIPHALNYPHQMIDIVEEMETSAKSDPQILPRPPRLPGAVAGVVLDTTDSGYSQVSQETPRAVQIRHNNQSTDVNYETEFEESRVLEDIFFIR